MAHKGHLVSSWKRSVFFCLHHHLPRAFFLSENLHHNSAYIFHTSVASLSLPQQQGNNTNWKQEFLIHIFMTVKFIIIQFYNILLGKNYCWQLTPLQIISSIIKEIPLYETLTLTIFHRFMSSSEYNG
jgi:hypothetical protein